MPPHTPTLLRASYCCPINLKFHLTNATLILHFTESKLALNFKSYSPFGPQEAGVSKKVNNHLTGEHHACSIGMCNLYTQDPDNINHHHAHAA